MAEKKLNEFLLEGSGPIHDPGLQRVLRHKFPIREILAPGELQTGSPIPYDYLRMPSMDARPAEMFEIYKTNVINYTPEQIFGTPIFARPTPRLLYHHFCGVCTDRLKPCNCKIKIAK